MNGNENPSAEQNSGADETRRLRAAFKKFRDETAAFISSNPEAKKLSEELHENVVKAGDTCKKLLEKSGETGPFMLLAGRSAFIDRAIHKLGVETVRSEFDRRSKTKARAAETRARRLQELKERVRHLPLPSNHVRLTEPLKILKRTDKAVQDEILGLKTWLPGSQITEGEGYVSGISDFIRQNRGLDIITEGRSEEHERNYQAFVERKEHVRREERQKTRELAAQRIKEEKEERARLREKAWLDELEEVRKTHPGAERMLVPVSALRYERIPSSPLAPADLEIVAGSRYGGERRIDEDMPSIMGSQLLGHEGERAVFVYVVKRKGSGLSPDVREDKVSE